MAAGSNARRYAQAVFEMALERNELDRWQSDLEHMAALGEDAEVVAWLEGPRVRFEDKAKLLAERLSGIDPMVQNLVYLLVAKARVRLLVDIVDEYQRLLDSHRGIEQAEVTTAVPLDDEGQRRLAERLGAILGKKIELKTTVDASRVGGMIVRVGGKLIDGSTISQLLALKRELVGTR